MSCSIEYRGKQYASKAEVLDQIQKDMADEMVMPQTNTFSFEVEGANTAEKIQNAELIKMDAVTNHGTDEFVTVTQTDGSVMVNFHPELLPSDGQIVSIKGTDYDLDQILTDISIYGEQEIPQVDGLIDHILERAFEKHYTTFSESILAQSRYGAKNQDNKDVSLKQKLMKFANNLGISVTTMEEYMEEYGIRNGVDMSVEALADMLYKVVALSDTNNIAHFTEEIAHFAIQYFPDTNLLNRMLEKVNQTTEYKESAERYRRKYSEQKMSQEATERMVRKEVLGKILAKRIQDNFDAQTTNPTETGIIANLQRMWNDFLNLFRQTPENRAFFKEFGKTLDQLSQDVLEGQTSKFDSSGKVSKEIYFSMTEKEKSIHNRLEGLHETLIRQYKNASAGQKQSPSTAKIKRLGRIRDELAFGKNLQAVNIFLSVLREDVEQAVALVEQYSPEQGEFNLIDISKFDYFNVSENHKRFDSTLGVLRAILRDMKKETTSDQAKQEIQELEAAITAITNRYNGVRSSVDDMIQDMSEYHIEKFVDSLPFSDTALGRELKRQLSKMDLNDIGGIAKYVYTIAFSPNSVLQLIMARFMQYKQKITNDLTPHITKIAEFMEKNNIGRDVVKLMDHMTMISTIDTSRFKHDYYKGREKIKDEYSQKISEVRTDGEKLDLETELSDKLIDYDNEWLEREFKPEFYERLKGFHPEAKSAIIQRAIERNAILGDYRRKDGTLDLRLTQSDRARLFGIDQTFRATASIYDPITGAKKTGTALRVAQDISKYYAQLQDSNLEISEEQTANFYQELERLQQAVDQASDYFDRARATTELQNFLMLMAQEEFSTNNPEVDGQFTRRKFSPDTNEGKKNTEFIAGLLGFVGENHIDELSLKLKNEYLMYPEGNPLRDLVDEVENMPLNQEDKDLTLVYMALRYKRSQLVSPYRDKYSNKTYKKQDPRQISLNQIRGDVIEENEMLAEEIDNVGIAMGMFKMYENEEGASDNVVREFNDSFRRKWHKIQKTQSEKKANEWLLKNTRIINGKRVPTKYYYAKYVVSGKPKVYKPNYMWSSVASNEDMVNENYDQNLGRRDMQISVNKRPEYRNAKFYELFGITENENDPYAMNATATRNKELWELRKMFLETKEEADGKYLEQTGSYFDLPRFYTQSAIAEGILNPSKQGVVDTVKGAIKSTFFVEDEEELGEVDTADKKKFGIRKLSRARTIFKYAQMDVRKHWLKAYNEDGSINPAGLSDDVAGLYLRYMQRSMEYQGKAQMLLDVSVFEDKLRYATFGEKGYSETNLKDALDAWKDANIFGHHMKQGYVFEAGDRQLSSTKTLGFLRRGLSVANLGWNIFSPVISFLNARMKTIFLGYIKAHSTGDSIAWAHNMTARKLGGLMTDAGKVNLNSEVAKLLRFSGADEILESHYQMISNSRLLRIIAGTTDPYVLFSAGGKANVTTIMYSIYDSYRLVPDAATIKKGRKEARFMNFQTYEKEMKGRGMSDKEIQDGWKQLKQQSRTYYDYLDLSGNEVTLNEEKLRADGYINTDNKAEIERDLLNLSAMVNRAIEDVNNDMDGKLSAHERSAAHQDPLAAFIGMHKSYFFRSLVKSFNKRHVDAASGRETEGRHAGLWRLLGEGINSDGIMGLIGVLTAAIGFQEAGMRWAQGVELDTLDKQNLRRLRADGMMFLTALALYILMNAAADDDEESFVKQYLAYIATRNFNETISTQHFNPLSIPETIQNIKSPIAGIGTIERFSDLIIGGDLFSSEEVSRGDYKGWSKGMRGFVKATALKNLYEPLLTPDAAASVRGKNMYFRNRLSQIDAAERLLELVNEESR